MLNRNVWPEDGLRNAFYAYFVARRRESVLERLLPTLPFLILTVLESAVLSAVPEPQVALLMVGSELLLLPMVAGFMAIFLVGREHGHILRGVNLEEILLTQLAAREVVFSIGARPISRMSFALILHFIVFLATVVALVDLSGGVALVIPVLALGCCFVWYTTRGFIDWGAMNANRVYFLLEEDMPKGLLAVKDFFFWKGFSYFVVAAPFLCVLGFAPFFAPLCMVLLLPFALLAVAGMAAEEAARMAHRTIIMVENNRGAEKAARQAVIGLKDKM